MGPRLQAELVDKYCTASLQLSKQKPRHLHCVPAHKRRAASRWRCGTGPISFQFVAIFSVAQSVAKYHAADHDLPSQERHPLCLAFPLGVRASRNPVPSLVALSAKGRGLCLTADTRHDQKKRAPPKVRCSEFV
jgi:hypothetical protein